MYFASQITLPENAANVGAVALALMATAWAVKLAQDIWRGSRPQPAYEDRFASKAEVAALRHEFHLLERRLNQHVDSRFEHIDATLQALAKSITALSSTVNAELQGIHRALGRLEGDAEKGGRHV